MAMTRSRVTSPPPSDAGKRHPDVGWCTPYGLESLEWQRERNRVFSRLVDVLRVVEVTDGQAQS